MYIETQYNKIALSEAKRRFKAGEEVLTYKPCIDLSGIVGYMPIASKDELIAGQLYEKVIVKDPNRLDIRDELSVNRFEDGAYQILAGYDYDSSMADLNTKEAKELAEFLLKPFVKE